MNVCFCRQICARAFASRVLKRANAPSPNRSTPPKPSAAAACCRARDGATPANCARARPRVRHTAFDHTLLTYSTIDEELCPDHTLCLYTAPQMRSYVQTTRCAYIHHHRLGAMSRPHAVPIYSTIDEELCPDHTLCLYTAPQMRSYVQTTRCAYIHHHRLGAMSRPHAVPIYSTID